MAWITSGLTNLKVQLNSLINDEEGYSKHGSDMISEEMKREFEESSQNNESYLKKDFEKPEFAYSSPKNVHEYRKHSIMVYCKRLSICSEEVVTLNSSLNFLVEQLTTTLNAHGTLKNELIELRKVLFDLKNKKDENSLQKRDTYTKIRRSSHSNVPSSMLNMTRSDFIDGKDSYYHIENVATNLETEKEAILTSYKLSDETTKEIESLTIAVDEARKMPHLLQKNLSEILVDTKVSEKLEAVLKEYFDYDELNSTTWQKLKLLFILPVMAKFRSANISELSVSDSVKEALQPNCSMVTMEVCPSNERNLEIPKTVEHSCISSESKNVALLPNVGEECAVLLSKHSQTEELIRLRKHLLSVEQAYTNELLKSEQEIQLLRRQLQDNDKKLTSMTELHTSLNVRTNQTIESLQNEVKKLSEDNQKLLARFKDCQIELQKSLSETYNIRSALDLFYKNKDSEIFQVTEKLRSSIEATEHENETLRKTVEHLREDLALSAEQLKERNILSNEMKKKEDEISVLRNEVFRLQTELKNSHFKTGNAKLDSETAMKFNLIKNIVFRYATSDSSITRMQSLRVLANVLEFSDYEKSHVGLCVEMDEHPANESLIGEFIRFVEKESLPKCDEVFKEKVTEHSQKSSHSRSLAVHSSMNAVTSSILKDVLHSDRN